MKKKVGYLIDEEVIDLFTNAVARNNMTASQVIHGAMTSYGLGELVLVGNKLESKVIPDHLQVHVSRETIDDKKPVGRPVGSGKNPVKEPQSKGLPDWYTIDHKAKNINTYPLMYQEPHPSSDPRAHLDWETQGQISGNTFQELCYDNYLDARFETTYRKWQGGGLEEFVQRCAMKFFAINRLQTLRFEAMDLQEGMFSMEEAFEPQITMAYDGGVLNDEDPK